jgi:hypothetical protein
MDHRDRAWPLRAVGLLLLAAGAVAAALGPVELFIFRWFTPGGRFHYEGFGFGSFMFANMTAQILGYYTLAAVFLPLGVGHLRLRRWVRPVALALWGFWLILGLPLVAILLAIALASKEVSLPAVVLQAAGGLAAYFLLPWAFLHFYRSRDVAGTLAARDPQPHWLEGVPVPLLVLALLYLVFALFLHVGILLNGVFPVFGRFVYGLPGAAWLDGTIWALVILAWGTLRRGWWAWWGGLALLSALAVSTVWTFWRTTYPQLLSGLALPPAELEILDGIPAQGWHLALFLGLPLLATLGLLLAARRSWRA